MIFIVYSIYSYNINNVDFVCEMIKIPKYYSLDFSENEACYKISITDGDKKIYSIIYQKHKVYKVEIIKGGIMHVKENNKLV